MHVHTHLVSAAILCAPHTSMYDFRLDLACNGIQFLVHKYCVGGLGSPDAVHVEQLLPFNYPREH